MNIQHLTLATMVVLMLVPLTASAQAQKASSLSLVESAGQKQESEDGGEEHQNAVELFLGAVTQTSESLTGFGIGLGYVRRFSRFVGLEVAGELSEQSMERSWLVVVQLALFPAGGLAIKAGPAIEGAEEKTEEGEDSEKSTAAGVRVGASWEFELNERFSLSPEINLDVIGGSTTWVYGLSLGYGF